jgi:hypothetical protein
MAKKQPQSPALDALTKASRGLLMPSESDAPFQPFQWEGGDLTPARVLQLAHEPEDAAVEEDTLDNLFATIPSADLPRFQALRKALQEELAGVKVFKGNC